MSKHMHWSLKSLFIAITAVAVVLALLLNANDLVWRVVRNATFGSHLVAAFVAVGYRHARVRALSFIGVSWIFLSFFYIFFHFENDAQTLVFTQLVYSLWEFVRIENLAFDPSRMGGASPSYIPEWYNFIETAILLASIVLGAAAAAWADPGSGMGSGKAADMERGQRASAPE